MTQIGLEYLKHKDNLEVAKANSVSQRIQADAATSQAESSAKQAEIAGLRQAEDARHNAQNEEQQRVMTVIENLAKTSPKAAIAIMAQILNSNDVPTTFSFVDPETGKPLSDEELEKEVAAMFNDFQNYIGLLNAGSILRGIGSISK